MALLAPGGRTLVVATGKKVHDDDELVTLDVFLITRVTRPAAVQHRRKAS